MVETKSVKELTNMFGGGKSVKELASIFEQNKKIKVFSPIKPIPQKLAFTKDHADITNLKLVEKSANDGVDKNINTIEESNDPMLGGVEDNFFVKQDKERKRLLN